MERSEIRGCLVALRSRIVRSLSSGGASRRPVGFIRAADRSFEKPDLLKRINLIWVVQSHLQKYSASRFAQINSRTLAVPALRGAYHDRHGRWAWDAVDAAASGAQVIAGRVMSP
jgi:hypothetical protein